MNENTRNAFASYGLEILKRSVLLVLYQQPLDYAGTHRRTLSQDTIRQRLGIPKQLYTPNRLVRGILDILQDDEYVDFCGRGGHWRITEKGVSVIEDGESLPSR